VARRLDGAGGTVLAAAVTTLEDDRAHIAFAQRAVDCVGERLGDRCALLSPWRRTTDRCGLRSVV